MTDTKELLWNTYLDNIKGKLNDIVDFWSDLSTDIGLNPNIKPKASQAIRVYQLLNNGHKRIMCADATSSGKTLTALLMKLLLDKEKPREDKKPHRVMLLAPDQSLKTGWSQAKLANYFANPSSVPRVAYIHDKKDLDSLCLNDAEIIAVNHHKLGFKSDLTCNHYLNRIKDLLENIDMVFVDESHNYQHPETNRSRAIKEISDICGKDTYFVLLSATPIPNVLSDAGVQLHLLDPEKYPFKPYDPDQFPEAFRILRINGQLYSFTRDEVQQVFGLPNLKINNPSMVEMSKEHADQYFQIWSDINSPGFSRRILKLRKLLLQSKFEEVKKIMEQNKNTDTQLLFFSLLKKDILDPLVGIGKEIFGETKVAKIAHETTLEQRIELSRKFESGEVKALFNTAQVAGEAFPLIGGKRPVSLYFMEPVSDPGKFTQIVGRPYRFGQLAPVDIYTLIAFNEELKRRMEEAKPQLEQASGVKFRSTWRPSTIDLDFLEARIQKEAIQNQKVMQGIRLSDVDKIFTELSTERPSTIDADEKQLVIRSLPPSPVSANIKFIKLLRGAAALYGCGVKDFIESIKGNGELAQAAKNMFDAYTNKEIDYKKTTSAYTNRFIAQVIRALESKNSRNYSHILDIGSGPLCLTKALKRNLISLDPWPEMLKAGLQEAGSIEMEKVPGGLEKSLLINGYAQKMPLKNESVDVAVSSYSIMYSAQGKSKEQVRREIEDALLEIRRVLSPEGYLILALPKSRTTAREFETFKELLPNYHFKSAGFTGGGKIDDKAVFSAFFLVGRKEEADLTTYVTPEPPEIFVPRRYMAAGGIAKKVYNRKPKQPIDAKGQLIFSTDKGSIEETLKEL